jgi:spore maturation protein A
MGSMILNIAANMLGLGNSATALGLRAMEDLQEINEDKQSASNPMATFLAINTSSVTIVPATVIALRVSAGSTAPAEIVGPAILATGVSTIVGITAAKLFQRFAPPQQPGRTLDDGEDKDPSEVISGSSEGGGDE